MFFQTTHNLLKYALSFIVSIVFWFLVSASFAYAADVVLAPSTGTYSSGQTFTVTIQVDPKGQQVNAVEAGLRFDPAILSVVSTSKVGSVFTLWTTEPAFSNTAGTITFGGGSPTPFSARSNLLSVTFRAQANGTATVSFSEASVLAADGRGTDVFGASPSGNYTISATATPPPSTTPPPTTPSAPSEPEDTNAAISFGDPPRAPEVGSQAFLDPELWYNLTTGRFTWDIPFDVTAVAVAITDDPEFVPSSVETNIIDPPEDGFVVTAEIIKDGIQYVSVQFENQVGWGAVNNRQLKIDTTPPEPFTVQIRTGSTPSAFPTLEFAANDVTSGIAYYELVIADREPIRISPDEARIGYLLGELEDGTYTARVTAYDQAGNSTVSSAAVLITAGWIAPLEEIEKRTIWSYFTGINILIFVLFVIIILMTGYIYFDRKQRSLTEQKLRRETKEIQDQMSKIFSALRDEIYDQINTITKRPRLSKAERDAVEQLNQALEVSETLIEKEINDVKSILK
jgi:hypothetical protein